MTLLDDPPVEVVEDDGDNPFVFEALTEEECYLVALLLDASGLDLAEFSWVDETKEDACWRAWPMQWCWWRCDDQQQVDEAGRSVGKSQSVKARAGAHPFNHPGGQMLITAPEKIHVTALTTQIDHLFDSVRLLREMLRAGRESKNKWPFLLNFRNGATIYSRIPKRDGSGVKGAHPVTLEQDECFPAGTLILTGRGLIPIEAVCVGDEVFTHRNRWRPVVRTFERGVRDAVSLRGHGHPGLICTPNHKFWSQHVTKWRSAKHKWGARELVVGWHQARDLGADFWATPADISSPVPAPTEIPRAKTGPRNRARPISTAMLWALGLYLAEGSASQGNRGTDRPGRVWWSVHTDEAEEVRSRLAAGDINVSPSAVQSSANCTNLVTHDIELAAFLTSNCGRGAHNKTLPVWVFGLPDHQRRAVLGGIVYGDGSPVKDARYATGRWKLTTTSKALAIGARILATTLGYSTSLYWVPPRKRPALIRGREVLSGGWYQVVGGFEGQGHLDDGKRWSRVRQVTAVDARPMYDLEVAEDHSFVADGIVVSNSQDYPGPGWTELKPTLQKDAPGSQWRVHGVTRGIPDEFWKLTQPGSGFTRHRITAYHRPTFTAEELESELQRYGSRNDPDFRRNLLGLHGDAQNAIFVLSRLMAQVDQEESSDYNVDEYHQKYLKFEQVEDRAKNAGIPPERYGEVLAEMLDLPELHKRYDITWAGMDCGIAKDPSAIMVLGEYKPNGEELRRDRRLGIGTPLDNTARLKLLARIELLRIPVPDQIEAVLKVIDFYKPRGLALDKTGNGLGILQGLQARARSLKLMVIDSDDEGNLDPDEIAAARAALTVIKGYDFGGKIVVGLDAQIVDELGPQAEPEEIIAKAGIKRQVKEYSTDKCRDVVDNRQAYLPYDRNLIQQLTGQTWAYSNAPTDAYGNRTQKFSEGQFHAFDGYRLSVLCRAMQPIEEMLANLRKPKKQEAVLDRFVSFDSSPWA